MESLDSKITSSPPAQEEPDLKKPKMSTTTTSDEEELALNVPGDDPNAASGTRKPKYKRRKVAIFFAYCGVGYQGMQKNPGAKTIEGDLEEALFRAGAVPEQDRNCPKRYDWARSARTDKGVSAVGQVVSGRFYVDPPGFVERLNSELPSQFRIFGYKRVTGSFSAKKFCDRRRYVYLIPVFALDPSSHRDRESVLASLGSGSELVKCFECSERGRKVVGAVGNKRTSDPNAAASQSDVSVVVESVVNDEGSQKLPELSAEDVPLGEENANPKLETETLVGVDNGHACDVGLTEAVEKGIPFSYGEEEKERFNRILSYYVGSHNFHNFTTRTKAEDPAAWRYIVSFTANTVVTVDGIEFVKCEVIGQSFMLHQIRKLMGVAVAIMRNCAPESLIKTALQKDIRITVPTAPEVGLYLDECFFTSYNQKWKDTHEEVSMKEYEEEAEEFKMKYIYPHIASTEHKEGVVGLWLHSLNHRNYPDLRASDNGVAKPAEETADVSNVEEVLAQ
ncbi:tRNA pseudouridine synthase 1 [Linum perenne]